MDEPALRTQSPLSSPASSSVPTSAVRLPVRVVHPVRPRCHSWGWHARCGRQSSLDFRTQLGHMAWTWPGCLPVKWSALLSTPSKKLVVKTHTCSKHAQQRPQMGTRGSSGRPLRSCSTSGPECSHGSSCAMVSHVLDAQG